MALTRAAVEGEVVSETGPLLALAGKAVTHAGSNADLNGPIAFALTAMGFPPADPALVADPDLAPVEGAKYPTLVDLAIYYAIRRSLNSIAFAAKESAQDRSQDWIATLQRFENMLNRLGLQYSFYLAVVLRGNVVVGTPASRFPDPRVPLTWGVGTGYLDH